MVGMRLSSRPVLVLAVLLGGLLAPGAPASASASTDSGSTAACTAEDVVVVVEPASLGGGPDVRCATGLAADAVAQDALVAAGHDLVETSGSTPFLCRVDGRPGPDEERCGASLSGSGYWAFLLADEGGDWTFAQTGLREQRVQPGQFVALRYQLLADGEDVPVQTRPTAETRERTPRAAEVEEHDALRPSGAETAVTVALALVLLAVVVGIVVVARRRRP
jgi:hypothetical protein